MDNKEVKNLFKDIVEIDEKERLANIRKSIKEYQAEHKKMFGGKYRKKPLINRFSDKIKQTIS